MEEGSQQLETFTLLLPTHLGWVNHHLLQLSSGPSTTPYSCPQTHAFHVPAGTKACSAFIIATWGKKGGWRDVQKQNHFASNPGGPGTSSRASVPKSSKEHGHAGHAEQPNLYIHPGASACSSPINPSAKPSLTFLTSFFGGIGKKHEVHQLHTSSTSS